MADQDTKNPVAEEKPGDYARDNSQMQDAIHSPANAGVKHGDTETDENGNFTGDGATSNRANDPLVNRDAVSPAIQVEKPETNVARSAPSDAITGEETKDDGNWEMRAVPPYDQEGSKDVMENYRRVLEESKKDDPVAVMNAGRDKK